MSRKLWSRFLLTVMQSRIYAWLVMRVVPYVRFKMYYTSLRGWKYKRGYKLLQPGDILLTKSAFFDICKESDRVVVLRCNDWDTAYIPKVIATCKSYQDVPYDITFMLGIRALYCSEMVVMSDPEKRLIVSYDDLVGMNRPYISPVGLYRAKNVTLIWDSDQEKQ